MTCKKKTIEKFVEAIRNCLDDGVVFVTHLTEGGQVIHFYNLDRDDYIDGTTPVDAFYAFERVDYRVIDFCQFNPEFYPEMEENRLAKN